MTWHPCRRIVGTRAPVSFRVNGLYPPLNLQWPVAAVNSGADYSVDFSGQLCCDDAIARAAVSVTGGNVSWVTISGTLATAWINWTEPGRQTATVSIRTRSGATLSQSVSIPVSTAGALLSATSQPQLPDRTGVPPNALNAAPGTVLAVGPSYPEQIALLPLLGPGSRPLLTEVGGALLDPVPQMRTDILILS